MKRAFTLIELLVAITIVAVISGGALVYLNNFNSRQRLIGSKDEVVSALKLAQSYAKTRQLPLGSGESELKYVQVQVIPGGWLVAGANGIGSTYFMNQVYDNSILMVGMAPAVLYFWGGNGFLSHDNLGTMFESGETAKIDVQLQSDVVAYEEITIGALGQIVSDLYTNGVAEVNFSGLTPTPTLVPTATPIPTLIPTSTPTPSLTPTPTCRAAGVACTAASQCCSASCRSSKCR